jgi:hypothetical protein
MSFPHGSPSVWSNAGRPSSRRPDRSRWPQHADGHHDHGHGADDGRVRLVLSFGHHQLCRFLQQHPKLDLPTGGRSMALPVLQAKIAPQSAAFHARHNTYSHGLFRLPGGLCLLWSLYLLTGDHARDAYEIRHSYTDLRPSRTCVLVSPVPAPGPVLARLTGGIRFRGSTSRSGRAHQLACGRPLGL